MQDSDVLSVSQSVLQMQLHAGPGQGVRTPAGLLLAATAHQHHQLRNIHQPSPSPSPSTSPGDWVWAPWAAPSLISEKAAALVQQNCSTFSQGPFEAWPRVYPTHLLFSISPPRTSTQTSPPLATLQDLR